MLRASFDIVIHNDALPRHYYKLADTMNFRNSQTQLSRDFYGFVYDLRNKLHFLSKMNKTRFYFILNVNFGLCPF